MEIAVIADVHGNALALETALNDLKQRNIHKIIILGDLIFKGPMPQEVLILLMDEWFEILAWIQGNTEAWLEELDLNWQPQTKHERELFLYYKYAVERLEEAQIQKLIKLPKTQTISCMGHSILCVHGTPKSEMEAFDEAVSNDKIAAAIEDVKEEVILGAHSHTTFFRQIKDQFIFNPGSIGNSLEADKQITYGILKVDEKNIDFLHIRLAYPVNEILKVAGNRHFPLLDHYKKVVTVEAYV